MNQYRVVLAIRQGRGEVRVETVVRASAVWEAPAAAIRKLTLAGFTPPAHRLIGVQPVYADRKVAP